ncbi:MAG TPA: hypothetical protein DCQ98_16480 [Planctomycetaceae bacterium]|nr:hypothetical protein [Planctomycetaceae bacterium]HRF00461.1 carbohydrate-binding family 9-like protein [Pirellulaceae bacterium]
MFGRTSLAALLVIGCGWSSISAIAADEFPPVPESGIPRIVAYRVDAPPTIDGRLDEAIWSRLPRSRSFVDLIGGHPTKYATDVAVGWDDSALYLGYRIEEPNVAGSFTERDSPIWQENDVEFFIAGDDAYYEFEINSLGTIYEGLFVWEERYESSGLSELPELDRRRPETKWQKFDGVGFTEHPRGDRLAFLAWDFPGLRSAVHVDGTLNDDSDIDRGWTVELAIPWQGLALLDRSKPRPLPPHDGDIWRMDFSRFNKQKTDANDSGGWAHSHHGVWDSHLPECFTFVTFSTADPPQESTETPSNETAADDTNADGLDERLASALETAGENRVELERALAEVPADQRRAMRYLIAYMPRRDLTGLDAEFLLENVAYAYRARESSEWAKRVPETIFFDAVLPYASINERRDRWRKDFHERFAGMVADAPSATAAATKLNREIFGLLDVRYSTGRPKADQSPYESIEAKLASCTGLSVLLIDACRAVGVPARLVGTPLWSDMSGNHSWVEVWDGGWHFTGAAEASGEQLDQAWFIDRASRAIPGDPRHAIFATSWAEKPLRFPLVWARRADPVWAVDVTHRYVDKDLPLEPGTARVRFVVRGESGSRAETTITLLDEEGNERFRGTTRDERFDANDHLTARLPIGWVGRIRIGDGEGARELELRVEKDEQLIELR